MEKNEKNIDNLFKDTLHEFEVTAPDEVWENISNQLIKKKSKKLVVFWYRFAAGAAILLTSSWFLLNNIYNNEENDNISENKIHEQPQQNFKTKRQGFEESEKSLLTPKKQENAFSKQNQINKLPINTDEETKLFVKKDLNQPEEIITSNSNTENNIFSAEKNITKPFQKVSENFNKLALLNIKIDEKTPIDKIQYDPIKFPKKIINPKKTKQWEVGGYYAPLYSYRALEMGENDAMANTMINDAEQGQYTYAGGFSFNYKITEKLSVGTGLSVVNHSYEISNVASLATNQNQAFLADGLVASKSTQQFSVSNTIGEIKPNETHVQYFSDRYSNFWASQENSQELFSNMALSALPDDQVITQSFDYIELPLLFRYRLIDRNLGLHLVSGVSSYFLVNNHVTIKSNYQPDINGKTVNIRTTNVSGSLGLGLNYTLTQSLKFNVEPMFKIFLNSINSSNSLNAYPYSLGIYSGIFYSF